GTMTDLGTLGRAGSGAAAINASGQVVGYLFDSAGRSAFVWENGVLYDLNKLIPANSGWVLTQAQGINNSGQIVGFGTLNGHQRGFLLSDPDRIFGNGGGTINDLGTLGGDYTAGFAVNDAGQVVGQSKTATGSYHAFLWQSGVMKDLGTTAHALDSGAIDINASGQLVGESVLQTIPVANSTSGFLWQNNKMTDINTLIPSGSGWTLTDALGINGAGQIVGPGSNGSRAFLMTPGAATVPALTISDAPSVTEGNSGTVNMVFSVTL